MTVAVIGVGRGFRGDDSAGLEAVRRWQHLQPVTSQRQDIRVARVEEPGLELLDLLEGMDAAILVDAVITGAPPGTLRVVSPDDLAEIRAAPASAHGWGVAEALMLGRTLDPRAADIEIRILGIEAARTEMGTGLSPEVEAALPRACETIQIEVTGLLEA